MSITRSLPMLPGIAPPSSDPRPADREDAYQPFDPGQEDAIVDALFDAYLLGMPLVVGFSGGKDSHLLLALVWKALGRVKAREPARLATPVIVMVGDTMTENPVIQMRTATSVASIRAAARRDGLPIYAEIATPAVGDLLLVRIIGHGYPAMTQNFRWCVERVKAGPSARAVDRIIGRDTPAIFVLGTRKGESAARKRNMEGRAGGRTVAGIPLQPNPARPGSFAYEPLADVTLGQVWCHLESRMLAPWGDKWLELAALYKESSDACPVQMPGTSRDTCGNSRFGCWCCTVVKNERSLRNLAAGAAPWMGKMVVFRDLLHETTQGEARYDARSIRGGETETIKLTGKGTEQGGTLSPRGYTMTFRKRLLALLLDAEDDARRLGPVPDYRLIDDNALREIQRVWEQDWGDWEQSAVEIARPYRGEAWAYSPHPRLAPRRHIPGHPAALCRKALVQHRAHDVDLPPLLLWRFVDIAERFRDDPSYRGLVAANRRMAQLTACDWRSDGIIVADLLWERAIERTGEEDRHLQAAERQRLVARAVQPALVEMEQAAPPPT
jgi:DNA sulfur modification protein DndC